MKIAAAFVAFFMLAHAPAAAQDEAGAASDPGLAAATALGERVNSLSRDISTSETINRRRVEAVEAQVSALDSHVNRALVIMGFSSFLLLMLAVAYWRTRDRLSRERISRAVREAETLFGDIRREMSRPEAEFLRTGQILQRMMRECFDRGMTPDEAAQAGVWARNPHLPVLLHFMARTLVCEHEKRWQEAVVALESLRILDPGDPFVLLHFSHVHMQIAAESANARERKQHQQTSSRYYADFALTMRAADQHRAEPSPLHAAPHQFSSPARTIPDSTVVRASASAAATDVSGGLSADAQNGGGADFASAGNGKDASSAVRAGNGSGNGAAASARTSNGNGKDASNSVHAGNGDGNGADVSVRASNGNGKEAAASSHAGNGNGAGAESSVHADNGGNGHDAKAAENPAQKESDIGKKAAAKSSTDGNGAKTRRAS